MAGLCGLHIIQEPGPGTRGVITAVELADGRVRVAQVQEHLEEPPTLWLTAEESLALAQALLDIVASRSDWWMVGSKINLEGSG